MLPTHRVFGVSARAMPAVYLFDFWVIYVMNNQTYQFYAVYTERIWFQICIPKNEDYSFVRFWLLIPVGPISQRIIQLTPLRVLTGLLYYLLPKRFIFWDLFLLYLASPEEIRCSKLNVINHVSEFYSKLKSTFSA